VPVKQVVCATPAELLDRLSPLGKDLPANVPNKYIFRGHASSQFSLLPSAYRVGTRIPTRCGYRTVEPTWTIDEQLAAERDALLRFFWLADQAGLNLPGDSPKLRNDLGNRAELSLWPMASLLSVLALAQHHGLPTRLLDWSRSANVAAYFAAREAARWATGLEIKPSGARAISIWALDAPDIYEQYRFAERDPTFETFPLRILTAPQSSNPNLHAQKGIFTLLQENTAHGGMLFKRISLDSLAERLDPPLELSHFTLPIEEAPALLHALAVVGICASTVFPGYWGVVEALREESQLWD
jgi:FRG domain